MQEIKNMEVISVRDLLGQHIHSPKKALSKPLPISEVTSPQDYPVDFVGKLLSQQLLSLH